MLKDGPFSRIFVRTGIACIRLITPACCVYLFARALSPIIPRRSLHPAVRFGLLPLDVYATLEVSFYVFVYLPRSWYLNRPTQRSNPLPTPEERSTAFNKTWEATRDPRAYVSLWFQEVDVEGLHREDVRDWIHWGLWNGTERRPEHEAEVDEYLRRLEGHLQTRFPSGRGPHKAMMVTTDPLRMAHRPLFLYQLVIGAVDVHLFIQMWYHGYQYFSPPLSVVPRAFPLRPLALFGRHRSAARQISYFYRPHKSSDHLPVLFIHGIGIGLGFYLQFLQHFAKLNPDIGIIALEILPISTRITRPVLRPDAMAREVEVILAQHGWDRVLLMTHSYGSVVAAHLLRSTLVSPRIGPLFFIDPVTFSFHPPEVAWNFLRRKPTTASEYQLQYFASLDPGVAQALTRSFVWVDNSLWREDVEDRGARCTVALAGKDIITDTHTLGAYLTRKPRENMQWYEEPEEWQSDEWKNSEWTGEDELEVMYFKDLNHSEVFDAKVDRDRLMKVIASYTRPEVSSPE